MDNQEELSISSTTIIDNQTESDESEQKDAPVGLAVTQNEGLEVYPAPALVPQKPLNMSAGAIKLRNWLNKCLSIEMSDGRVLVGIFLCTDRDANVILGSCTEYLPDENKQCSSSFVNDEPRMLGLVMVPGKHIVSISIDENEYPATHSPLTEQLKKDVNLEEVM